MYQFYWTCDQGIFAQFKCLFLDYIEHKHLLRGMTNFSPITVLNSKPVSLRLLYYDRILNQIDSIRGRLLTALAQGWRCDIFKVSKRLITTHRMDAHGISPHSYLYLYEYFQLEFQHLYLHHTNLSWKLSFIRVLFKPCNMILCSKTRVTQVFGHKCERG